MTLLHGPRQCEKTTLARKVGAELGYAYFSFDDVVVLSAAKEDPTAFVGDLPTRTILDEVQRVPELFATLKAAIDRDRTPGRFLLTGSANVLLVPKLADSLAGRMEILRLHPLAQVELAGETSPFLSRLFEGGFELRQHERLGRALVERIVAGGYPAALSRSSDRRRAVWYRDYVEALIQRDLRDLARIRHLDVMPRLLSLLAAHTASRINLSDLASPFHITRPTVADYVTHLERVFLVDRLSPWHTNHLSRAIKTPKIHLGDSGVAATLLGHDVESLMAQREVLGSLLETFVFQELRRQASGRDDDLRFHHYRDRDQREVDIVIERGARQLAGVELKVGATVRYQDFRGLRQLQATAPKRFTAGVVLYDGEATVRFGEALFAVPVRTLWESA